MDKIYAGSAKIISTQYGDLTKISFHKEDINKIVKYMKDNDSDWCNLAVKEKKEPVEGKPTHYLEIDQWKPENKEQNTNSSESTPTEEDDGLPF